MSEFDVKFTTPAILAEVNNLSRQLGEPIRTQYFAKLREEIFLLTEQFVQSREAASQECFVRFGLTDSNLYLLAKANCLVLTGDFPLYFLLTSRGFDAINFNHLRPFGWEWLAGK